MTKKTADPEAYTAFAARYDAFAHAAEAKRAFLRRVFEDHHVQRVLDCACGTGKDLVLLHRLGCDVCGSDLSGAMLDQARGRLAKENIVIPLRQADFRDLSVWGEPSFDAVLCLSTSLPHLKEDEELICALASMRSRLRGDGILILDQGMTDRQWAQRPRFVPVVNTGEFSRLMAIDYEDRTFTVHVLDFLHNGTENGFYHDVFTYRLLLCDDYARLLHTAGFRDVSFFGSFSMEAYNASESRRLIVIASG